MKLWALLLAALVGIAISGCASMRPSMPRPPQTVPFNGQSGELPLHFTTALTGGGGPVAWRLRLDRTGPRGMTLVQESTDDTSYRFPMCVYDGVSAADVSIEVRFKPIGGSVDQAGGIVLRYRTENYYVARANALEDNVNLFKTVNGNRIKIAEVAAPVAGGQWHTLRFTAHGSQLQVWLDGKVDIAVQDTTFVGAGKVGLWTKADSVTAFSDLKITRW